MYMHTEKVTRAPKGKKAIASQAERLQETKLGHEEAWFKSQPSLFLAVCSWRSYTTSLEKKKKDESELSS